MALGMTYDVVIIGGGPAGSTAACLLARAGWSVAVVEKKSFPRRKVCGEFLSATTLPLLRELGIADIYLDRAGPEVRRVGLFANSTVLSSAMPQAWRSQGRWGRALGRETLDLALIEAAAQAGAQVWQPWTATQLQRVEGRHICRIAADGREREFHARIVIAAQGSWERGPTANPNALAHGPSDLLAFKAHFRDSDLAPDLMPLVVFPGGYGGLVRSDGGRVTLSCCIRRDELERARKRHSVEHAGDAVVRHIQDWNLGARQALDRTTRIGAWLAAGPIRPGIRPRYANGVFFVGNIAGEAHPIIAEGISMAMQSAWLLCRQLISRQDRIGAGPSLDDAGREYGAEWKTAFARRVRTAAVFAQLSMRPEAVKFMLPLLEQFPQLLTIAAQRSGKAQQVVPAY